MKLTENGNLEGHKLVFTKRCASKMGSGEVRFKKKLDSFTLETSKTHLIRSFLRNGRLRVNIIYLEKVYSLFHMIHKL